MSRRRALLLVLLAAVAGVANGVRPDTACAEDSGPTVVPAELNDLRADLAALADAGAHGQLLDAADAALEVDGSAAAALEYRAFALERLGYVGPAIEAYERLVESAPEHIWGLTRLGSLLTQAGDPTSAREILTRTLALDARALDARAGLAAALRAVGDLAEAETVLVAGLAVGADPATTHAELAYLAWARGDRAASAKAWSAAASAGADRVLVDHGRRLLVWERRAGQGAGVERQRRAGHTWTLDVSGLAVESGLGPKLPREVEAVLAELPGRYGALLGLDGGRRGPLAVQLSRTIEEHETHRRALFPAGSVGRAFLVSGSGGGRGRWGREGAAPRDPTRIYASWASPTFLTSLSHEIAHAVLRDRARAVPVWLDEGLATYLELPRDGDVDADPGRVRSDLLAALARGRAAGRTRDLDDVLGVTRRQLDGPNGREHYAAAWSVVHFLLHGVGSDDARRRVRFESLLDAFGGRGRREGPGRSLRGVYGLEVAALDRAWKRHLATLGD